VGLLILIHALPAVPASDAVKWVYNRRSFANQKRDSGQEERRRSEGTSLGA
jgi:hypothetical protein